MWEGGGDRRWTASTPRWQRCNDCRLPASTPRRQQMCNDSWLYASIPQGQLCNDCRLYASTPWRQQMCNDSWLYASIPQGQLCNDCRLYASTPNCVTIVDCMPVPLGDNCVTIVDSPPAPLLWCCWLTIGTTRSASTDANGLLSFNATQFHSYAVCAVSVCYIVRLNECFISMFTGSFIPPTRQEAKCLKLYRHEQGSVTDLNTEQGG